MSIYRRMRSILGDPEADSGSEGKSKRAEKYGTKKSKERREEPLRTMSYQTSSKRSPPFCLLIGARKLLCFSCPHGLFSPFFTFLRAILFRPFRLSLAPTICPWVSKDGCVQASKKKQRGLSAEQVISIQSPKCY